MAGKVLPLFGPAVPVISIAFGDASGKYLTVPSSLDSAVTTYLPGDSVSLIALAASGGNFLPPTSPSTSCQVPSSIFASFSPDLSSARRLPLQMKPREIVTRITDRIAGSPSWELWCQIKLHAVGRNRNHIRHWPSSLANSCFPRQTVPA